MTSLERFQANSKTKSNRKCYICALQHQQNSHKWQRLLHSNWMFYQDHHSQKVMLEVLSKVFICHVCRRLLPLLLCHLMTSSIVWWIVLMTINHWQSSNLKTNCWDSIKISQSLFYSNTFLNSKKKKFSLFEGRVALLSAVQTFFVD